MIYIGEADPVGQRLTEHARVKDFWTQGVVFTSKDDALNKAYIKHLESRLITLAQSAKRCVLDNGNSPELPSLSEADRDDAEGFLADMLLLLPLLGIPFFESAEKATATTPELHLYGKNVSAHAVETPGGFVVLKGSLAVAVEREANSTPQRTRALRQELIHNGVLARAEEDLVFTQDYVFSSPSAASDVILGTSSSGPELWKDGQGQSLKEAH